MLHYATFYIEYRYKGQDYKQTADKLKINNHEPFELFYRVQGKKRNHDFVKVEGRWMITGTHDCTRELINAIGAAIEQAEANGLPYKPWVPGGI